jgi:hypothetical protein
MSRTTAFLTDGGKVTPVRLGGTDTRPFPYSLRARREHRQHLTKREARPMSDYSRMHGTSDYTGRETQISGSRSTVAS